MFKIRNSNHGSDKKFVLLFDMIGRQSSYDEEKIKRNPVFTNGQIPNLKVQLYQKCLDTLRFNAKKDSSKKQVEEIIDNANLLYDRCLYGDCIRQLDKAKAIAIKHDLVTPMVKINELQQLALRLTVDEKNQMNVDALMQEMNHVVKRLKTINGFSNLSLKLNSMYARTGSTRNKEELKKVSEFFKRKLAAVSQERIGIEEQMYYYHAITGYYFFIRNYRESKKYALKWVTMIESIPELKYQRIELYIKALNSLLVAQNKLYLTEEFTLTHRKLIAIKRDKKINLNRNLNLQLFRAIYIHEMNRHFMIGDFKSGTRIVARHQAEINRLVPLLDQNTVFLFYYKIACLYLGASQFRQALSWLNKITMAKLTHVREDIQSFARILRLICYFEMNDDYGVQSNIKSTYRFLLSRKNYGRYESLIILFLKNLEGNETQYELRARFIELQSSMTKISKLKYEKRAFIYFDMIAWLESKIRNQSIQEVFKERIKKGIRYEF